MWSSPVLASSASSSDSRSVSASPPRDLALLGLALELLDDLRGRAGADVGVDQRLLEPLPGLLVEVALEQRGLDLGLQRLAGLAHVLAHAAEEAAPLLLALLLGRRRGAGAVGDEEVVPVSCHGTRENRAMPEEITVRAEAADSLIAVRLVDAMVTEMEQLYSLPAGTASEPARRRLTSRRRAGRSWSSTRTASRWPAAASSATSDGVAEIKRMYVVPDARRQGLGRRLLEELEEKARELGYARIRLDTGARQPHAQAMYERAGYHPIDELQRQPQALAILGRERSCGDRRFVLTLVGAALAVRRWSCWRRWRSCSRSAPRGAGATR